ncbi:isoleucine--tRNA ligase [Bdellovibrio bacteriovorus]|uniref:Isoleucine--tRNA ligase n=1 Tax=Bdellovibrio bacteriovorus TaxID=959 RepID=A0A150WIK3_BDEBC|nr:isoleucine--tRNA ligase [Bdellovibrio bacteriovorus]KYG63377.1 isoleucine--tRNA ligase [Bdellovibrio bacteriovorus]
MTNANTTRTAPYNSVKPDVNLSKQEESILDFWDQEKIFAKSLDPKGKKTYSFYDGPPFATGLPHYGHLLAGVLKDVVPRYWTMKGYTVPRRFGWDCHGLPVEYEINKAHKIESRKDVFKMGVANYNDACRGIVKRYSEEWKTTVRRVGRWVDMENPYFTMDVSFMESVWWVFQQLFEKGLIYEGYKVVPYSVGISTSLSNFEANQNYKMVQDPAITVMFKLINQPDTAVMAWTTTPWTLPSNLALAVGLDIDYVKVQEKSSGRKLILAQALLPSVFKKPDEEVEVLQMMKGKDLVDLTYEPLFPYFGDRADKGAFRIISSDHVTTDSGTGVVHMAPAFGEEDYYACSKAGIPLVNPVDDDGMFTSEVPDYAGKRVKDADKDIIADLKKRGNLFKQDTIQHSYPYCYRSDTPLIYRAVSSWFVAVEKIKENLVANNKNTSWVPDHLRDGRFGNWLENARDWAISRNRFWGTPLPLWRNKEGEVICIGSCEQLEKLSGKKVTDLHIEFVDEIEIPSPTGKSPLKRVDGVLDCWFESGSMPYAQWGFPNANVEEFKKAFPAQFIAEGLDQTRGWFYTLSVIGTALFNQAPFQNVVVNGLVLAEDGRKMSKSLRNYPDPMEVLNQHGADALRLYLIDSPVVKAQELKFSEKGVYDVVRKILLRWWNSYSFFANYANIDGFVPKGDAKKSPNILDQWVLSRLNGLIANTHREMDAYRLYNVVPHLLQFIEDLTNTYIRFNRSHFWQDGMPEEKRFAYETLHEVLVTLARLMAPFAPFMSETTYKNLAQVLPNKKDSVHLESFPEADLSLLRPELEEAVKAMDVLVTLGRNHREKIQVKAKIPLREIRIIHRSAKVLETLKRFEPYFIDELNFRKVNYDANEDQFVQITAKANFPVLGKRLGPKMKAVGAAIQKLQLQDLLKLENGETITVEGEEIQLSDVEIRRAPKGDNANLSVHQVVSIEVDPTVTPEQEREGLAREIMRKIQVARKTADFQMDDKITLDIACAGALLEALNAHKDMIVSETLTKNLNVLDLNADPKGVHTETSDIDGEVIKIGVTALPRS